MAELYYANLDQDKSKFARQKIMQNAFYRLSPIYHYLKRAIEVLEQQQYKLRWEAIPVVDSNDETGIIQNEDMIAESEQGKVIGNDAVESGYNIRLSSDRDDEPLRVFDEFCNANYILDSPGHQTRKSTIQVLDAAPDEKILIVERLPRNHFVYLRPNDYVLRKQRDALQFLQNSPWKEHLPLIQLTVNDTFADWVEFSETNISQYDVLTKLNRPGTDKQRKFVRIALNTEATGSPDFTILEGPPGSGKTTAICELIIQAIKRQQRVLLCASTHIAVDNVLERLQNKSEIIAVRIGEERKVKRSVQGLTLERRKQTEKVAIIKYLNRLGKARTESQDFLLKALRKEEGDNVITKIILDSANLICGTTIGFLQHPDIRATRNPEPVFDLMILDEASKTTFQEFLVPALYAKRWVLSGDIRQLSPYVDEKEVEGNIKGLLGKEENDTSQLCLDVFGAKQRRKGQTQNLLLVGDSRESYFKQYYKQCENLGLDTVEVTSKNIRSMRDGFGFLEAQALLIDQSILGDIEDLIPPDMNVIVTNEVKLSSTLLRRREYWRKRFGSDGYKQQDEDWQAGVTWRLIRNYELRRTPDEAKRYENAVEDLLPGWYDKKRMTRLRDDLKNIKQIALPSCLELLQTGFSKSEYDLQWESNTGKSNDYPLACGLPTNVLQSRHVMLDHQHRMHPDISRFPREHIYLDPETGERVGLQDPKDMESLRDWMYNEYRQRRFWIDVKGKKERDGNINYDEIESIVTELERFRSWTQEHPNPEKESKGFWTLAILTFYRGQEREISKRLRKYFNRPNFRYFNDKPSNLKVEICTVDRFQGHEADMVFLSFVRNGFGVGFLDSVHRMNVALTRARYQLLIFGNRYSFIKAHKTKRLKSKLLFNLAKETKSNIEWR